MEQICAGVRIDGKTGSFRRCQEQASRSGKYPHYCDTCEYRLEGIQKGKPPEKERERLYDSNRVLREGV